MCGNTDVFPLLADYKIDWDGWANLSRVPLQEKSLKPKTQNLIEAVKALDTSLEDGPHPEGAESNGVNLSTVKSPDSPTSTLDDAFDTTIAGPWMDQWPIVVHNRHTMRHQQGSVQGWHKA